MGSVKPSALFPQCAECDARWLPSDQERWRAFFGCDEHFDEPAELVFYCPDCAERQFERR